jgi:hypothetical protein
MGQRKTPPSGLGEVPSGGVLREEHCSVLAAIPELVESSRWEKRVISGFSTGVSLPAIRPFLGASDSELPAVVQLVLLRGVGGGNGPLAKT